VLLYDIGNTNIKCYDNGQISVVDRFDTKERFYYINVNPNMNKKLKKFNNGINLAPYFKQSSHYKGIGIDRVASSYTVDDGVIVDAGSAITVDVKADGHHEGGFILPGIGAYKESFANISSSLVFDIDENIDLKVLPNSTNDALNFALFKSIYLMISDVSKDKNIYFCGGDGELLSKFFKNSIYKKDLLFNGMIKVIKEMEC
jgi:type III pantothenate kinase